MSQEHGYQRSGKKCREKFENLYKYYKKTKDGKAGRQDGKHYRFFRHLEALYGVPAANNSSAATAHFHGAVNVHYNYPNSNDQDSCDCDTTSSYCTDSNVGGGAAAADDDGDARVRKRRGKMRRKIEASIEAQMRSMVEKQEAWMERMARAIEGKEQEWLLREEQWRRQDAARIDGEHKMWAAERAWIEARDNALMDAFNRLAGRGLEPPPPPPTLRMDCGGGGVWPESEVARPIQLRSGMDLRFQENGISEEAAWDEVAAKMAACGGDRSGAMCMEKWDHVIGDYLIKCSKKRKEGNAKGSGGCVYGYDQNRDHPISDHGAAGGGSAVRLHGGSAAAAAANDGLFRYLMGDSYQRL